MLNFSDDNATIANLKYNNGLVLACGYERVFRSTDIGGTWDTISVPAADYKNIYFSSDDIIFISGLNGALIKSTDGGKSFVQINQSLFVNGIQSASFVDSLTGYLSTNIFSPEIYKTTNGGIDFKNITCSTSSWCRCCCSARRGFRRSSQPVCSISSTCGCSASTSSRG